MSGLVEAVRSGKVEKEADGALVSACELAMEGLCALKKLARTEEHGDMVMAASLPNARAQTRISTIGRAED